MQGFHKAEDRFPTSHGANSGAGVNSGSSVAARVAPQEGRGLLAPELDSALQLLIERAQYITGATGTALALPHGKEMVCRASAGDSAPAVGARLQVVSGLTGESISRRQLLRCDNAETDPRVNLEACRALGIASIVVLPLFYQSGELRGLIELFSDHPYAFEERDLVALERMADLTLTALDIAEQQQQPAPTLLATTLAVQGSTEKPAGKTPEGFAPQSGPADLSGRAEPPNDSTALKPPEPELQTAALPATRATAIPEAMRRLQKCAACGFPISEGRTICLDCEGGKQADAAKDAGGAQSRDSAMLEPTLEENFVPAFLANAPPVSESWFANHVNILAIIVFVLAILVAIVVFR